MSTPSSPLTIDLLARVLSNSIFHPFIAWLIPLCLRSLQAPYHSFEFRATSFYASIVTLCWILSILNNRIAYGRPRVVDWDEEVVVITGGANGLGRVIAETYGMRGARVAVLDVDGPDQMEGEEGEEGLAGVKFYRCDIGNAEEVVDVARRIQRDLGTPTILINNAGIVNGKRIWELSAQEVQRNMNVNLLAHFHTIRTFLPGMLTTSKNGGTIVTIASVLGKLGASHLSDYCAAKAGLIAMHTSLRSELASSSSTTTTKPLPHHPQKIRTILVTPGQLSTRLFSTLQTPSNFFGPVVETVELAREIISKIDAGESGEISFPFYARWIEWNFILPRGVQEWMRVVSGIDRAMGLAREKEGKGE